MSQLRVERILFATDFLESSRLALDYAVAVAHHFKAHIVLLHAIELSPPAEEAEAITERPCLTRKAAQQRLDAFAAGLRRNGLAVETRVEDGSPCQVILDAVDALRPDLLVLGVHGVHRGIGHLLIGSNAEKILLSVSCPTLSVGAHVLAGIDLRLRLKEVLYCSDLTPQAAAAVPYALRLGEEFNVPVRICHLAPPHQDSEEALKLVQQYCNALRETAPAIAEAWCRPAFHRRHGFAIGEILRLAKTAHAGLIVLGIHAETQLARHLHTSLAYQLLTRAVCPVLSIRAGPQSG